MLSPGGYRFRALVLLSLAGSLKSGVNVETIEQRKKANASQMGYDNLFVAGASKRDGSHGRSLSLAYGDHDPTFEITGTSLDGTRLPPIPFEEIETITYRGLQNGQIWVKVMWCPHISVTDLVNLRPSWMEIDNNYRQFPDVLIPRNLNGTLTWKGRPERYGDIEELGLVEGTRLNSTIRLIPPSEVWWSVPWVTKDPNCPLHQPTETEFTPVCFDPTQPCLSKRPQSKAPAKPASK
jgi:hypothetical protein